MNDTVQQRSDALAKLMEQRLGVRGRTLEDKLRRAGRRVPRWVRRNARALVEAERLTAHPKLMVQCDAAALDQSYQACARWLESVDPSARIWAFWRNVLAVNAFNLLVIAGALLVALRLVGLA